MSKQPTSQTDLVKVLKAANAAGLTVSRIIVEPGGRIVVEMGGSPLVPSDDQSVRGHF